MLIGGITPLLDRGTLRAIGRESQSLFQTIESKDDEENIVGGNKHFCFVFFGFGVIDLTMA